MKKASESISKQIDAHLSGLKQNGNKLPYGSYAKIAKKFVVSRELVRQLASEYNFKITRELRNKGKECIYCNELIEYERTGRKFCDKECRWKYSLYKNKSIEKCNICKLGILIPKAVKKRSKHKIFYCSHKCYAKSDFCKNHGKRLRRIYGSNYFIKLGRKGNIAQHHKINQ